MERNPRRSKCRGPEPGKSHVPRRRIAMLKRMEVRHLHGWRMREKSGADKPPLNRPLNHAILH
jgi:hypothetical protein